ncbi:zinc finger BED domain-containing 1-like [Brachionus plicatilis]|uniref:Zinc finger BED domain-containing 1-like n=1 Tax=Brachionus plicatilis TaxID=10195 RepID=A0A3M7RVP9_BRAPC|nr:zinc finger BED domain-containing 1-like [Brachionus plicatilis]
MKFFPHNDNSTSKMFRHLEQKHDIKLNNKFETDEREKDPFYLLLMFIITASLPFRCVENKFFKLFCHFLNPNFKLPSRKDLSDLASVYYEKEKKSTISRLREIKSVSLTTDCWTSVQNFSCISLTAHFFDDKLNLKSMLLAVRHILGGHTARNLSDNITCILDEFSILRKTKFITTDNVNTMLQMSKNLGLERIPCIAHLLNLIVSNWLKAIKQTIIRNEDNCPSENPFMTTQEIEATDKQNFDYSTRQKIHENIDQFSIFSQALEKCSSIASYYNHSTMMKEELIKKQSEISEKQLSIVQQVTRWNSTFLMVESVIKNKESLNPILSKDQKHKNLQLKSNEVEILEDAMLVLQTFYNITEDISSEYSATSSLIIPAFTTLIKACEINVDDKHFSVGFKQLIKIYIDFYTEKYGIFENKDLVLAAFLDPRYKKFSSSTETQRNEFIEMAERQIRDSISDFRDVIKLSSTNKNHSTHENKSKQRKGVQMSDSSDNENEIEINWRSSRKQIN